MPDITDIFLGDLPLTTSIGTNDTVVGVLNGRAQRVKFSDFIPDQTVYWADIENKPFEIIDTDVLKIDETLGGDIMLTFSDSFVSDINSIKSHISLSNSDYSNSNLNSLLSTLATNNCYRIKPTSESGLSNPTLVPTGDAYTNSNLGTWELGLMSNICGNQPTSSGSGEATQWSWSYNSASAMGSTYVLDLKRYNFDNTWTSQRSYQAGAVVVYDSKLYQCITANSDTTFTPAKWNLLSGGGGGGGIGDTPQDQWHSVFTAIVNGLTRALDIHYRWEMEGSTDYVAPGSWDTYKSQYGYDYDSDTIPDWSSFTDESLLSDNMAKFRGKLLETIKGMTEAYIQLGQTIRSNTVANNFDSTLYSRYVFNNQSNNAIVYNPNTDLILSLVKLLSPKVVKGKFPANGWQEIRIGSDYEGDIYTYECHLDYVSNPHNVSPWAYNAGAKKPSNIGCLDEDYVPMDMIMDLDEAVEINHGWGGEQSGWYQTIEYFEQVKTLREAYSKIYVTNIADMGRCLDAAHQPTSWTDVTALLAVGDKPPTEDIPVKFLVFPYLYNLQAFQS